MKIVVLSDTHMPRMNKKLPDRLARELSSAAAIVHGGDWTGLAVCGMLEAYAPVYGVAGNNDGADIVRKFGWKRWADIGGKSFGIVHGHGAAKRTGTEAHAIAAFRDRMPDILIYGHTHVPVLHKTGTTIVLNPGSPTDKRKMPRYSFALVELAGEEMKVRHVFYDDKL